MSTSSDPIGWLLLRDGHAVPLRGLAPDDLKRSKRDAVQVPGLNLKHTTGLKAIVGMLGFKGDFGDYKNTHWPRLQEFMQQHGLGERADLFERHIDSLDLWMRRDPTRRALADRVFAGGAPPPSRAFTGYGFDFTEFVDLGREAPTTWTPRDDGTFDPKDLRRAKRWLEYRRTRLLNGQNYIGTQLLDGAGEQSFIPTMYLSTDEALARTATAWKTFRQVIDEDSIGWVEIIPFNDRLAFLKAHDGSWDVIWSDLREVPPTKAIPEEGWRGLPPKHQPSWLAAEPQFKRWLYMRRGHWEEKVLHEAETRYYDQGGEAGDAYPGSGELVRRFLVEEGVDVTPATSALLRQTEDIPAGFTRVSTPNGTSIGVSPLVSVADFMALADETGWLNDRKGDDLAKANPGATDLPAGVTWHDAVAYCAGLERNLGVRVRPLTSAEHRAMRPFASDYYREMAQMDFPWENAPPLHGLQSAVAWSEPRFQEVEPSEDAPHPTDRVAGSKTWRKRYVAEDNWPPGAAWAEPVAWAEHNGVNFIDAWDAYEWVCGAWNSGYIAGRYWEGQIGLDCWGAYKNCKIGFRVVVELADDLSTN